MAKTKLSKNSSLDYDKENIAPVSRKRPADEPCYGCPSSKVQITWAVDPNLSGHIYHEMGVEPLSDNSLDAFPTINHRTPSLGLLTSAHKVIPQAPRVLQERRCSSPESCSSGALEGATPVRVLGEILRNDDNFLCRRVKNVVEAEDHFNKLSDEMILNIFRWLPRFVLAKCSRACKRWSRLVLDESLWRRIDMSNKSTRAGVLGKVLSRGVLVLRLARAEINTPLFAGFASSLRTIRMSKVQYLDLSMAEVSTSGLTELFSVCGDLKKISLENCELNDAICRHMGENRSLDTLNLCMCQGITTEGIIAIAGNCKMLDSINLAWTALSRDTVSYLTMCLPSNLSKLNLSGCRENISDTEVVQLVQTCSHLKELDLSDATMLTCDSVHMISKSLHGLEYLALSRCYHIMPSTLPLLNRIVTLLAVDVFGMLREIPLQQLRESMPRIEINKFPFSSIARPTTGIRRTSLWGLRVRDTVV